MGRALVLVLVGLGGLLTGALLMVSIQAPATPVTPPPALDDPEPRFDSEPVHLGREGVLLVWTASGLPGPLVDQVAELPRVEAATTVAGGRVDLVSSRDAMGAPVDAFAAGWAVPLDALAVEPTTYADFVPAPDRAAVEELRPGTALLGATSAELRRLEAGDTVTLEDGNTLTVSGVVDDTVVGAAELVVTRADAASLGIATDRFMLLRHSGERAEIEAAIRRQAGVEVRVRGPGETPWMRHGDAVLPQALVKAQFGEFAYRPPTSGRTFEQDPTWVTANIDTVEVPILGRVRCHRGLARQLRGALEELDDRGLAHLIDPDTFAGCHNPRLISDGGMPSRHAWGTALDLNADSNPTGLAADQDDRLVETFARWGLTWGGFWLVPDPMHIEYVGPPGLEPGKVVPGQ